MFVMRAASAATPVAANARKARSRRSHGRLPAKSPGRLAGTAETDVAERVRRDVGGIHREDSVKRAEDPVPAANQRARKVTVARTRSTDTAQVATEARRPVRAAICQVAPLLHPLPHIPHHVER